MPQRSLRSSALEDALVQTLLSDGWELSTSASGHLHARYVEHSFQFFDMWQHYVWVSNVLTEFFSQELIFHSEQFNFLLQIESDLFLCINLDEGFVLDVD